MAIVDIEYEKWQKDFEDEFPDLFKGGSLTGPVTALRRDLMRTAYMAGKKASRQPEGAQGIDLGQFRERVAEVLRSEFDLEVADPEDYRHDDGSAEAERIAGKIAALINGRDAGAGVE